MAFKGVRLPDARQELYKDKGFSKQAISLERILMKRFDFQGPKEEILRLLDYINIYHARRFEVALVDEYIAATSTTIHDTKILTEFPMLKAVGFVLETDEKEKIIYSGVLYKESGFSYPNKYQRIGKRSTDVEEYQIKKKRDALVWPLVKHPAQSFFYTYETYERQADGNMSEHQKKGRYAFPFKEDWNKSDYIFCKNKEYYLYDMGVNYEIENGELKGFSGTQRNIGLPEEVKCIGESVFKDNDLLVSITLPGISEVKKEVFSGCVNLKKVEFKPGLKSIGADAFSRCEKLVELILPDSVEYIGDGAFFRCGVGKVVWPKGVNTIPTGMFRDCPNLYEIVIPPEVTSIGRRVFSRANTVIIYGEPGSTAEQYANSNGMYFKSII